MLSKRRTDGCSCPITKGRSSVSMCPCIIETPPRRKEPSTLRSSCFANDVRKLSWFPLATQTSAPSRSCRTTCLTSASSCPRLWENSCFRSPNMSTLSGWYRSTMRISDSRIDSVCMRGRCMPSASRTPSRPMCRSAMAMVASLSIHMHRSLVIRTPGKAWKVRNSLRPHYLRRGLNGMLDRFS